MDDEHNFLPKKAIKVRMIKKRVGYISAWDFEGNVAAVISMLRNLNKQYPEFTEFTLDHNDDEEYGNYGYAVWGTRPETEDERKKRAAKAKKTRAANKKRKETANLNKLRNELALYKRLKKKFDPDAED